MIRQVLHHPNSRYAKDPVRYFQQMEASCKHCSWLDICMWMSEAEDPTPKQQLELWLWVVQRSAAAEKFQNRRQADKLVDAVQTGPNS